MSINGVWFDPNHDGCGFVFVNSTAGTQAFFFGHDSQGRQFWLTGHGDVGNGVTLTHTTGLGFPTSSPRHEANVGLLRAFPGINGVRDIQLQIETRLIGQRGVDVNPAPPMQFQTFRCVELEPEGKM